jgi:hypothetical protein
MKSVAPVIEYQGRALPSHIYQGYADVILPLAGDSLPGLLGQPFLASSIRAAKSLRRALLLAPLLWSQQRRGRTSSLPHAAPF